MSEKTIQNIDPSARVYQHATVERSVLDENSSVGDFSKVVDSKLGGFSRIDRNNHVDAVSLGVYSYTGRNTVLLHCDIGAFCSISWNVSIGGADHDYSNMAQHSLTYDPRLGFLEGTPNLPGQRYSSPLKVGNDVWIAAGAVVTRGVIIGDGAVVGANAVVTKDVPPYAIVAGSPARVIKYRFDKATINILLKMKWWDWPAERISQNIEFLRQPPSADALTKFMENNDPI